MAVSRIEEKILGRLATQLAPINPLLSSSLFTVLGLSIQLSVRLYRARRLRRLDSTRDTKSLQLYHHIIWLAREGLSITEASILPYLQDGNSDYGVEYRVMAAKMQASLRHVLCLFDSTPNQAILLSKSQTPHTGANGAITKPNKKSSSPQQLADDPVATNDSRRRNGKAPLRDPIPSMTSDTSYVTNPFAGATSPPPPNPPPGFPPPPTPNQGRGRTTPVHPPGLPSGDAEAAANIAAHAFLLNDADKVPATRGYFAHAQQLADDLLAPTHALRLSVALDHAAFLWDCARDPARARKLARRAIRDVYASADGLDDEEFADASALVQALGGFVKRGGTGTGTDRGTSASPAPSGVTVSSTSPATPAPATTAAMSAPIAATPSPAPRSSPMRKPPLAIDRTIAISPAHTRNHLPSPNPGPNRAYMRTPERLSTVAEDESSVGGDGEPLLPPLPPPDPISTSSSPAPRQLRIPTRQSSVASTAASEKSAKRLRVEQAEAKVMAARRQPSPAHSQASSESAIIPAAAVASLDAAIKRERARTVPERAATRSATANSRVPKAYSPAPPISKIASTTAATTGIPKPSGIRKPGTTAVTTNSTVDNPTTTTRRNNVESAAVTAAGEDSGGNSRPHSRQATPPDGLSLLLPPRLDATTMTSANAYTAATATSATATTSRSTSLSTIAAAPSSRTAMSATSQSFHPFQPPSQPPPPPSSLPAIPAAAVPPTRPRRGSSITSTATTTSRAAAAAAPIIRNITKSTTKNPTTQRPARLSPANSAEERREAIRRALMIISTGTSPPSATATGAGASRQTATRSSSSPPEKKRRDRIGTLLVSFQ